MPPQISSSHRLVTPTIPLLNSVSPKSRLKLALSRKYHRRMNFTGKKIIPTLVFVLTIISVLRLLKISITTSSPLSDLSPTLKITPHRQDPSSQPLSSSNASTFTEKELLFLSNIISHRAPCNLLIFGLQHRHNAFSSINAGGTTIILEETLDKLSIIETNSSNIRVYKVEYKTPAKEAYNLLKHARKNPGCSPHSRLHEESRCKLALTKLPKEVYKLKWDVVVVDGPSGDGPEAPGRMAAIYTASVLARSGNMTNVVVHDVDRVIEKWFSWEFLCEENLVSAKGKFWNFRIAQQSNSTIFCPA